MKSALVAFGLTGFFVGVVLYFFLFWIVLQRKKKERLEQGLLCLLGGLLVWYAGNFVSLLLRQMAVTKVALVLGVVDAVSFTGLAVLPPLLLHTHWLYYQRGYQPRNWERKLAPALLTVLYATLLLLPLALIRLFPASQVHPIQKLGMFSGPFLGLLSAAYYGSCLLEFRILQRSRNSVEKALFTRLFVLFLLIPVFNFYVFFWRGDSHTALGQFWMILALLTSVLPSLVVTYYIYHYRFLHIVVHRGIATVLLILVTLWVYLAVIRRLVLYLQEELAAPPLLVEGIFLAAVLLLFPPLSRWLESHMGRLFSGEIRRYRELADTINQASPQHLEPSLFREFIEETLRRQLQDPEVRIQLEEDIVVPAGENFFPLQAGDRTLGFLKLGSSDISHSTAQREALRMLANEIAFGLERSQLMLTKLEMERELARKSHMEELGRMAASVAHNVKNPLSSIKTLMQLLLEAENLNPEQRREVLMMIGEVDRLSKTISSLLNFSRLESQPDRLETPTSEVNLQRLLDSIHCVFRGDLQQKNIQLETTFDLSPPVIRSDADILTEILGNLLSNALEAGDTGGRIRVHIRGGDQETEISVEDDGPGIPNRVRDRLFEPFVTTKARGTGLGLAIVRKRVSQLGGRIQWEQPAGRGGTRFLIRLPAM